MAVMIAYRNGWGLQYITSAVKVFTFFCLRSVHVESAHSQETLPGLVKGDHSGDGTTAEVQVQSAWSNAQYYSSCQHSMNASERDQRNPGFLQASCWGTALHIREWTCCGSSTRNLAWPALSSGTIHSKFVSLRSLQRKHHFWVSNSLKFVWSCCEIFTAKMYSVFR